MTHTDAARAAYTRVVNATASRNDALNAAYVAARKNGATHKDADAASDAAERAASTRINRNDPRRAAVEGYEPY